MDARSTPMFMHQVSDLHMRLLMTDPTLQRRIFRGLEHKQTCFTYVTLLLILTITHTDIILGPWVNCIVVHFFFLHCSQTAGLGLDLNLLHLPEHGGPSSRSHSQTNISADFLFLVLLWQSLYWLIIHLLFLKGCNLKFSTKPWEKSKMTQNHNLWMLCLLPLLLHRQRKHKTTLCL